MRMSPRLLLSAATIFFLAGVVGVSTSREDAMSPEAASTSQPPDLIETESDIIVPLQIYLLAPEEQMQLERASQRLANDCLQRFGEEPIVPSPDSVLAVMDSLFNRRYGVVDLEVARIFGYGYPPKDDSRAVWNPSRRQLEILTGVDIDNRPTSERGPQGIEVPERGCAGSTRDELIGDAARDEEHLIRAANETLVKLRESPELSAATDDWAACMYSNEAKRFQTRHAASDSLDPGASQAERIDMAVQDISCARQVSYVERVHAADVAIQEEYIAQRGQEFEDILNRKGQLLRRVAHALGDI